MQLESYRILFISISLIGVLLFASPTISLLIETPAGEQFSDLYILGSNHAIENIPFNIENGVSYSVYLGVDNNLGLSSYYNCLVKFGNYTESRPSFTLGTHSELSALYTYNIMLREGQKWETLLTFRLNNITFSADVSKLSSITINGVDFPINESVFWDSNNSGYYYTLFVELWRFDSTLGQAQYDNRFVCLLLNMTRSFDSN